jgi:hypothetical protein
MQSGSTYHHFLGINPNTFKQNKATSIAQLKARLEGVDYIFIDEVFMLSCHDMYKISAKLAKAMNIHDLPLVASILFLLEILLNCHQLKEQHCTVEQLEHRSIQD